MKNTKILWLNKAYSLDSSQLFSEIMLNNILNSFWSENVETLPENQHLLVLFKCKYVTEQLFSIGPMQKLNKEDKQFYIDHILDVISVKDEFYLVTPISEVIISYRFKEGTLPPKNFKLEVTNCQSYYNNKIPLVFYPHEYGNVNLNTGTKYVVSLSKDSFVIITKEENVHHVELFKNNQLLFTWVDRLIEKGKFLRELGKSIYTIVNNEIVLHQVSKSASFISKTSGSQKINNKIITMDVETVLINNVKTPYLLCWYDGENKFSYFIKDFKNFDALLLQVIEELFIKKYDNYKIYFHNMVNFDLVFLLKSLSKIPGMILEPLNYEGKLKSIKLKYKNRLLHFRDSYLLLPASLNHLCVSFYTNTQKSIFPVLFNEISHIGEIPEFKYFVNIDTEDYAEYLNGFFNSNLNNNEHPVWNFKDEAIKYCLNDCISLYEILIKFNELIFNKFKLNINDYPTLTSLAFKIYRSVYMPESTIAGFSGKMFKDLKEGYTGGAVDMFVPTNEPGELVYGYDVNSLYPFVMLNNDMPVGKPNYFKGDIRKFNPDAFGFFFVEVETPEFLLHPIIQLHHRVNGKMRTLSPLGKFKLMLFSEEMDNAVSLGYKFNILWGYTFNRGNIFKDFISDIYNLRFIYPKSDPMNYVANLLLNSLYGRLGMNDNFPITKILDRVEYKNFEKDNKDSLLDVVQIGSKFLIKVKPDLMVNVLNNEFTVHNVNVAIASAITSYARIHMSQFKNLHNIKLFYTDTDSIYVNKPLPEELISSTELGKLKLDSVSSRAIFLAPKFYSLITLDNLQINKIKGLKKEVGDKIPFEVFETLLFKNESFLITQVKWFKSIADSQITLKDELYSLKVNNNKRNLVYFYNKLINTRPIHINPL